MAHTQAKPNSSATAFNPFDPFAGMDPAPSPVEQPAEPVPAEDTVPAPTVQEPSVKKPAGRVGRPRKTPKSTVKIRGSQEIDPADRDRIAIYVTKEEKKKIFLACFLSNTKASNLGRNTMLDFLNNSYLCTNPGCNCQFTLNTPATDEAVPQAVCCPACGSDAISPVDFD